MGSDGSTAGSRPLPTFADWVDALPECKRIGAHALAGPCPVCGGTDRFHVRRKRDGGALVGCRGCIDGQPDGRRAFGTVLTAAFPGRMAASAGHNRESGGFPVRRSPELEHRISVTGTARAAVLAARRLWQRSVLAQSTRGGTPALDYLVARRIWPPARSGFPALPPDVRWIPKLHRQSFSGLPKAAAGAIAFGFRNNAGELTAVSLEALTSEGRRLRPERWRRTRGVKRNACFSAVGFGSGDTIVVCEGELDALATLWLKPGTAEARAYGGTTGLANADLPKNGAGCLALADGDEAGRDAARALRKRNPGLTVVWSGCGDPAEWLAETIAERAAVIGTANGLAAAWSGLWAETQSTA